MAGSEDRAFSASETLASIVAAAPRAAETFVWYGLDFCWRGERTLADACAEAKLDAAALLEQLARLPAERGAGRCDDEWPSGDIGALLDAIIVRFHEPLRREVPALVVIARMVEQIHCKDPARPAGLAAHLEQVQTDVECHLMKEEQILFPLLRAGKGDTAHMPLKVVMQEHADYRDSLRRTRALASDLLPPRHACGTWRSLYRRLAQLEADLWKHVHLENEVLFPRASLPAPSAPPR